MFIRFFFSPHILKGPIYKTFCCLHGEKRGSFVLGSNCSLPNPRKTWQHLSIIISSHLSQSFLPPEISQFAPEKLPSNPIGSRIVFQRAFFRGVYSLLNFRGVSFPRWHLFQRVHDLSCSSSPTTGPKGRWGQSRRVWEIG